MVALNASITEVDEHIQSGFSIWLFKIIKKAWLTQRIAHKKICESLRKYAMNII